MFVCVLKLTFLPISVLEKLFFLISFTGRKESGKEVLPYSSTPPFLLSWNAVPAFCGRQRREGKRVYIGTWRIFVSLGAKWPGHSLKENGIKKLPSVSSEDWIFLDCVCVCVAPSLMHLSEKEFKMQVSWEPCLFLGTPLDIGTTVTTCCHLSASAYGSRLGHHGEV